MTSLENKVQHVLEGLGFRVHDKVTCIDPSNTIYYQWKVNNYRLDFALPYAQIAIEVDGSRWHSGIRRIEDQLRDKKLRQMGWKILRLSEYRIDKDYVQNSIWLLIDV